MADRQDSWQHYLDFFCHEPHTGFSLDLSRIGANKADLNSLQPQLLAAFDAMAQLEAGAIANPDEQRMVGHYWLRHPSLAPSAELRAQIEQTVDEIEQFAAQLHQGKITAGDGRRFTDVLCIGIGGSALGPQWVADALGGPADAMRLAFIDNTDPDGIERTILALGERLATTLVVVISKSGGTAETRNGMLETKSAFDRAGLEFARHAVAVTGHESKLDRLASSEGWLRRLPMWDWVGGRTSQTAAVGLLPAALQGLDIRALLSGAAAMDAATRVADFAANPAARLAIAWYWLGGGRGERAMVVLPYKDRLLLFSRYLQQLVMESLGKQKNLKAEVVEQGLVVYGNKGSTDQHAYVQQLRDGRNDFFVTFVEVLKAQSGDPIEVEPATHSADYLHGFLHGTREALAQAGRPSITLTLPRIDVATIGALIALYERAVGLYASMVEINAYDQPGVEAGKQAAGLVLAAQRRLLDAVQDEPATLEVLAQRAGIESVEQVFQLARHLAANGRLRLLGELSDLSSLQVQAR